MAKNTNKNKKKNKNNSYTANSNSKYNRYEKQDKNLQNKKTKGSEIEYLDDLDSTKNLDDSFIEGIRRKKVIEEKTEILDVEEINKANTEFKESINLNNRLRVCSYLLLLLVLVCVILVIFIIYHFSNFDHNDIKVIEKESTKEITVVDDNYVFLGDSITAQYDLGEYFSDVPIVNSGKVDSTTGDILDKLDELVYQYNPSIVFISLGIDDLKNDISNTELTENVREIINNIKDNRPYCKIYLQSIYPVDDSDDSTLDIDNELISELNKELVSISKEEDIIYIDLYSKLLSNDVYLQYNDKSKKIYVPEEGYELVTEMLNEYIK